VQNPPADQPLTHLGDEIQDFADTAAIVSQLDLVICVDTHLLKKQAIYYSLILRVKVVAILVTTSPQSPLVVCLNNFIISGYQALLSFKTHQQTNL
jgi:hypothetical protein